MAKLSLMEKEMRMLAATEDPSVACVATLGKAIGVSSATAHNWLLDSEAAFQAYEEQESQALAEG